jgi:hypothetical protein
MATLTFEIADDRLEQLKKRAEAEGLSVSDFLLRNAEPVIVEPPSAEFWNRLKNLPRVDIGMSGADAVREAREAHDREIDEWLGSR